MAVVTTPDTPDRATPLAMRYLTGWGWKAAVLAALAVWLCVVGAHHEPWVDESQAWLVARDNGLIPLLVERVRYEGTPGLWHLLLWLSIRCGLPFAGLFLIPVACALAGATLLLWRAPFPGPLRALLVASYFGAYQYAVVARSYALDLILLPALACLFAQRKHRPIAYGLLVGLLANSNAHSFLLAGVLGGEWLLALARAGRMRAGWIGLVVAAVLGACALLVAWQPADNGFLELGGRPEPLVAGLRFVQEAFVDRLDFWSAHEPSPLGYGVALSLLLLLPSVLLFQRAGTLPLVAVMAVVVIGFSVLTYANAWHSGILFLVWIFGLWIAWPALATSSALRRAVLASMAIVGTAQAIEAARSGLWDIRHPYSGSARAAQAIADWRAAHPQARIAAAGFKTIAVQPYFPANIFANYHGGAPRPSYIVWKRGADWQPYASIPVALAAIAGGYDLLLLSTFGMQPADLADLMRTAGSRGYRAVATYPGSLHWKGYAREDDTLMLLVHQPPAE